jgi:hypothetical protein
VKYICESAIKRCVKEGCPWAVPGSEPWLDGQACEDGTRRNPCRFWPAGPIELTPARAKRLGLEVPCE